MSQARYGVVQFSILKLFQWKRSAIHHGPNYVYTRNLIGFRATINRTVDPYIQAGDGEGTPARVPGAPQDWFDTDQSIRHYLLQPRRKFLYLVYPTGAAPLGADPAFESPLGADTTDANNGPIPLECNVVEWMGPRTYLVDFIIQTDINECQLFKGGGNPGKPATILDHTWDQTDQMDQDFYNIRTTRGRVIFSASGLASLGTIAGPTPRPYLPDDFRRAVFHPIHYGQKRESVMVQQHLDGVTLDYEIRDRERSIQIPSQGVTRIKASHSLTYSSIGALEAGAKVFGMIEDIAAKAAAGAASAAKVAVLNATADEAGKAASLIPGMMAFSFSAAANAFKILPQLQHRITVQLWGDPLLPRIALEAIGKKIIQARLNNSAALWGFLLGFGFRITHDIAEQQYVELEYTFFQPPLDGLLETVWASVQGQLAAGGPSIAQTTAVAGFALGREFTGVPFFGIAVAGDDSPFGKFADGAKTDNTGNILVRNDALPPGSALQQNAAPGRGNLGSFRGERGTYVEVLVRNYFWTGCLTMSPDPVTAPGNRTDNLFLGNTVGKPPTQVKGYGVPSK